MPVPGPHTTQFCCKGEQKLSHNKEIQKSEQKSTVSEQNSSTKKTDPSEQLNPSHLSLV